MAPVDGEGDRRFPEPGAAGRRREGLGRLPAGDVDEQEIRVRREAKVAREHGDQDRAIDDHRFGELGQHDILRAPGFPRPFESADRRPVRPAAGMTTSARKRTLVISVLGGYGPQREGGPGHVHDRLRLQHLRTSATMNVIVQ